MRGFFNRFPKNLFNCFRGWNLLWHFLAIILTYILVISGFDWFYFSHSRNSVLGSFLFPAVILGAIVPLFGILIFFAVSTVKKNQTAIFTSYALGQAAIAGLLISDFYKAFTGRMRPPEFSGSPPNLDISRGFRFGFLQGGVFFGWPSSHTTIAFAMATTLIILFPKNKLARYAAIFYALYVGIGVSMTIHWFSDFAAGAIIGTVIGVVVGKSFCFLQLDLKRNGKRHRINSAAFKFLPKK